MQLLQAANIVEDKSVPVFTEPIEKKWYTVFILLFGVRHTFPKPVLPNPTETGWAQAEDQLVPAFITLNSNSEALLACMVSCWCTPGCATRLCKCRKSHFVCTGQCGCTKVDANCRIKRCYSFLTLIKKRNISSIFLKRLKDLMD